MAGVLTRESVEETAMELIRDRKGFTLDEVAAERRVTLRRILEVVGDEDQLLQDLREFNGASILVDCRLAAGSDGPVSERVHDLLHALIDNQTILAAFPARTDRADELRRECRRLLRDLFAEGIVDRSLACDDAGVAADLALDAVERFHTWGVGGPTRHMVGEGVDPVAYDADPWPAMVANEVAFARLWIVVRPALGIRDATKAEVRLARDLARRMRELWRAPVA